MQVCYVFCALILWCFLGYLLIYMRLSFNLWEIYYVLSYGENVYGDGNILDINYCGYMYYGGLAGGGV